MADAPCVEEGCVERDVVTIRAGKIQIDFLGDPARDVVCGAIYLRGHG
jgi:hypothetical protein